MTDADEFFMSKALELARKAGADGEVPVGAIVVMDGAIIGRGSNSPITSCDPSCHAEVVAIRDAAKNYRNYRLPGASLFVTIEPCTMCVGTIIHARISRVVFGATEPKAGMLSSNSSLLDKPVFNHAFEWQSGVMEAECSELMSSFFAERRALKAQLKASTKS